MQEVSFRKARKSDVPAIIDLLADDPLGRHRESPGLPLSPKYIRAFDAIDADKNQLLIVATASSTIIGTLQLSFIPGLSRMGAWRGQIEGVRIAANLRNSGLGRRIIEWAIAECRNQECNIVQLTSDKGRLNAHRFYEQLGFTASHLGYKLTL